MADADGASSHRKLALIIGNNKYKRRNNRLKHSVKNAKKLSHLLKAINFNCTTYYNIDKEMMDNISNFAKTIMDGDIVLFYFSGHCRQVAGENYLIPTDDDRIENDIDVAEIGTSAKRALDRLMMRTDDDIDVADLGANAEHALDNLTDKKKPYVTIFILDCCQQYFLKNESTSNRK
jgi:uncharacterized caspase-like protein